MDRQKIWILGSVAVIAVIGALGWFLGVSPALDTANATAASATDVEQQNDVLAIKTQQLAKQMDKLPEYKTQLSALQLGIPEKPDQEVLYRELASLAAANGVTITDLTMVQPTQLVTAADLGASKVSIENFQTISIKMELNGPYANIINFVNAVQNGSRLVVFNEFAIGSVAGDGSDAFGPTVQLARLSGLAFSFGAPQVPITQDSGSTAGTTAGDTSESTDASGTNK